MRNIKLVSIDGKPANDTYWQVSDSVYDKIQQLAKQNKRIKRGNTYS